MTGRDRRRNAQPNAAMYVGYADDDEDVESIMAKFKAIEDAKGAKGGGDGGSGDDGVSDGKELTEEELIRATGARAPPKERVDYSAQLGHGNRANRKGEVVVAGTVELVPGHVPPEEIDPADAKDAADRLRAGEGFAPEEQEKCDVGSGNDARDPASGPPSSGIVPGVDVAMVNLKGFDAHTREKIAENMPHAVAEHDVDEFIDLVSQTMRLDAVAGADPSLESAAKTIAESKTATPAHRACAKALVKLCAKDPKEFKAKSKGRAGGDQGRGNSERRVPRRVLRRAVPGLALVRERSRRASRASGRQEGRRGAHVLQRRGGEGPARPSRVRRAVHRRRGQRVGAHPGVALVPAERGDASQDSRGEVLGGDGHHARGPNGRGDLLGLPMPDGQREGDEARHMPVREQELQGELSPLQRRERTRRVCG